MFNIKIKLSRIIGLFMIVTVFALILVFFFSSKEELNQIKVIELGKDLALAFITAIAVKGIKDVVKIKFGGKDDK